MFLWGKFGARGHVWGVQSYVPFGEDGALGVGAMILTYLVKRVSMFSYYRDGHFYDLLYLFLKGVGIFLFFLILYGLFRRLLVSLVGRVFRARGTTVSYLGQFTIFSIRNARSSVNRFRVQSSRSNLSYATRCLCRVRTLALVHRMGGNVQIMVLRARRGHDGVYHAMWKDSI